VIVTGTYHLLQMALAMREFSLVGKQVEGVVEAMHRGGTIITAAERKHPFRSRQVVRQHTVNVPIVGSIPTFGAISKSLIGKCLTSSQTIMVRPTL
jgi:hypothetical protein